MANACMNPSCSVTSQLAILIEDHVYVTKLSRGPLQGRNFRKCEHAGTMMGAEARNRAGGAADHSIRFAITSAGEGHPMACVIALHFAVRFN